MPLSFIFSVVLKEGNMCIGNEGGLLYKIPGDLKNFKNITNGNTVVMGYNTWKSLPVRSLPNRTNIVITNSKSYTKYGIRFLNTLDFKNYVIKNKTEQIYCIGGSKIFKLFIEEPELTPEKMIITHIKPDKEQLKEMKYDTTFDTQNLHKYEIYAYSENEEYENLKYRTIFYRLTDKKHQEYKYLETLQEILDTTNTRPDRTGVGVKSIFSKQLKFDISTSIPMLTTRSVSFKNITEELLWFCRGDTDANILKKKGVNIWNGNTTREFLDSRNLKYKEGILGPLYGFQMRYFGAKYPFKTHGFDQLEYVENLLKTDPFSRRIMMSYLNPLDYDKGVLLPCHHYIQFYVEEENGIKYLSCFFNMRSSDFALAGCYNITSYSILTYILATKCGMKPRSIVYTAVDCHVYLNHQKAVEEQLTRHVRSFPGLFLKDNVKNKDWKDIKYEDVQLIGYFPHRTIKMEMAV
jgi:thymidylate synthase